MYLSFYKTCVGQPKQYYKYGGEHKEMQLVFQLFKRTSGEFIQQAFEFTP